MSEPFDPAQELTGQIPSVVEAPPSALSKRAVAIAIGITALLFTLLVVGVVRYFKSRLPDTHVADGPKPTAATARAPGSNRVFGDAPPPNAKAEVAAAPVVEKFPAADEADARPIPLKGAESSNRGSSSGRPPPNDADGQVLLTPASTRGRAFASSSAAFGDSSRDAATEPSALDVSQRNLQTYQQQLNRSLQSLNARVAAVNGTPASEPPTSGLTADGQPVRTGRVSSLFGGSLQGTRSDPVTAGFLGNRSLILAKGTAFTCALKTKVVSAASGMVSCQVSRNVYSDDGRTVLIERGSQLDGEYRVTSVRPGITRIPTIWTRVRTPNGVVVDLESPATGALGEGGLGGYVDNRWGERIGAALLVGFLDDAVRIAVNNTTQKDNGDSTVVLSSTGEQAQRLPEKILESTINLPPLIYQNQGALVGIYLAHDVDFSAVYELKATP